MKRGNIIAVVAALTLFLAVLAFVHTERQRVAESRAKFEKIDRAMKSVETATGMGVTYTEFRHQVADLALEYAVVSEKVNTEDERRLLAAYDAVLQSYQDSVTLWGEEFSGPTVAFRRLSWFVLAEDEIIADGRVLEVMRRYGVAATTKPVIRYPPLVAKRMGFPTMSDDVINVKDALPKIWLAAAVRGVLVKSQAQATFAPVWVKWMGKVFSHPKSKPTQKVGIVFGQEAELLGRGWLLGKAYPRGYALVESATYGISPPQSLELKGVKVIIFSRKDLPLFAAPRQVAADSEPACGDAAKRCAPHPGPILARVGVLGPGASRKLVGAGDVRRMLLIHPSTPADARIGIAPPLPTDQTKDLATVYR